MTVKVQQGAEGAGSTTPYAHTGERVQVLHLLHPGAPSGRNDRHDLDKQPIGEPAMNPEDLPPQIAESLKALGFLPTPPTTPALSDDQFRRDLLAVLNRIADNLQPEMFPGLTRRRLRADERRGQRGLGDRQPLHEGVPMNDNTVMEMQTRIRELECRVEDLAALIAHHLDKAEGLWLS